MDNKENILEALNFIDPASLSYTDWLRVGLSLKQEGFSCAVWDNWSRSDKRYKQGECERKWAGFSGSSKPVTGATIVQMAKDNGYRVVTAHSENMCMDWNDVIEYDGYEEKDDRLKPTEQLALYLQTLFASDDYVGLITNDSFNDKDGKWKPMRGVFDRTQKELLELLRKYRDDLGATIGDWKPEAGAWIRINALDGKGARKENVTSYKFTLIECDSIPLSEQRKAYEALNLPIAALVYSGGKSLHAVVHIDAKDKKEYLERIEFLYSYLKEKGLDFDIQNKDENRMSRLPGATRNGKEQSLLGVNIGPLTYSDWLESLNEEELIEDNISEMVKNPPMLAPEIIEGVLRKGHKLLLSGASKSGKSFALIELSICFAEGLKFLGFQCKKSKVVYINFEIDRASTIKRFIDVYAALGVKNPSDNIIALNLRGKAKPLNELVPTLVKKYKGKGIDVFIIDPIYKVITGDENNATEMAQFCNQFDKICDQLNATIIYAHHHSKGTQGSKTAQDRSSGSGVFSRDPDAIMDFIELDLKEEFRKQYLDDDATDSAWQVEFITREFRKPKTRKCWFKYPLHVLAGDELNTQYAKGDGPTKKGQSNADRKCGRREMLVTAYEANDLNGTGVEIETLADYLEMSQKTIRRYVDENKDFVIKDNVAYRVKSKKS